jgi:hypothetical protein
MATYQELQLDEKFKTVFPYTEDHLKAMEDVATTDGEILHPLVSWNGTLIFGYPYLEILTRHPDLKHQIKEMAFGTWQDALSWAVEYYISLPEITLPRKLLAAIQCETYWLLKKEAKKAQGNRNNIPSKFEGMSESKEVNTIIAHKAGCSETYVYYFRRVYSSGRKDVIDACLRGELTIKAAHDKVFPPTKEKPKNTPVPKAPIQLDLNSVNILESEKNQDVGRKNAKQLKGTLLDPKPITEKFSDAKVPDGSIWIAVNLKENQLQIINKSHDKERGQVHIKVNSFNCRLVDQTQERIILEADHINGGIEEFNSKDDADYTEGKRAG